MRILGMRWWNLRSQSFFAQAVILVVFEVVLFTAAAPVSLYLHPSGIIAAGLAAGVCLASALIALWIHHIFPDPKSVLTSTSLGMAVNMGLPLAFGISIHLYGGSLSAAGFLYYLLYFYLPTLGVKTVLTLSCSRPAGAEHNFS